MNLGRTYIAPPWRLTHMACASIPRRFGLKYTPWVWDSSSLCGITDAFSRTMQAKPRLGGFDHQQEQRGGRQRSRYRINLWDADTSFGASGSISDSGLTGVDFLRVF